MHRFPKLPLTLLFAGATALHAQNLLSNPGFENTNPNDYWQLWRNDTTIANAAALSFPTTGAHEGNRYAKVEIKIPTAENWHIQLQLPPDWVADSGETYELKFWAKSDSSTSVHLGIQDGPDFSYAYRSGQDFSLPTEWTEETLIYTSDRRGSGALRFNLFLGRSMDTYGFDSFSLTKQPTGFKARAGSLQQALQVRQSAGNLILSLDGNAMAANPSADNPTPGRASEIWKADLLNLRGETLAAATGKAGSSLTLAQPDKNGVYFIRAATPHRAWVRKVSLGKHPQ